MSIVTAWSPFFQARCRTQGRAYHLEQRVARIEPIDGELVLAQVRGGDLYTVAIRTEDGAAIADCTCPAFARGAYCKHIWATLLDLHHHPDGPGISADELARLPVRSPKARKREQSAGPTETTEAQWIGRLSLIRDPAFDHAASTTALPVQRQVCYVVLPHLSARHGGPVVELRQRTPTITGWSKPKPMKLGTELLATLIDGADRELCALMLGAQRVDDQAGDSFRPDRGHATFCLPPGARRTLLRRMTETGRCLVARGDEGHHDPVPLVWDDEPTAWTLWLVGVEASDELLLQVELRRGDQRLAVGEPEVLSGGPDGVVIWSGKAAMFDDRDAFRWAAQARDEHGTGRAGEPIRVPRSDLDRFLNRLYTLPQLPEIDLPARIGPDEQHLKPQPHVDLFSPGSAEASVLGAASKYQLLAHLWFAYGDQRVSPHQAGRFVPVEGSGPSRLIRRDRPAEREAFTRLMELGVRPLGDGEYLVLSSRHLPAAVADMIGRGWVVSADRRALRRPDPPRLSVSSGVDWFELHGTICYELRDGDAQEVGLPQILSAARAGQAMVTLGDGSQGLLPVEWLASHGLLTTLGRLESDHLRFGLGQAALLDALLDERELVSIDEPFAEARQKLLDFRGIEPTDPTPEFQGTLRAYQREGLGWLSFLRWFGVGGILADDMGLGKTVQVLAMLQARYGRPEHRGESVPAGPHQPSLVVVPRSVVFNWIDEAARFTPGLRVLAYSGAEREGLRAVFKDHDLIVTSYGLLRRDIEQLRGHRFDVVVLDEAQAIKNPASQSAKAARLLDTANRLALTGTPIENHIGDIWSIFEFLNPGMLGSSGRFSDLVRGTSASTGARNGGGGPGDAGPDTAAQIAAALRPFILRRTKKQVLSDLPEKTEQTIVCEMEPPQRAVYDELRDYYRVHLLSRIDEAGEGGSRGFAASSGSRESAGSVISGKNAFIVLEALLRLRQAACHPALIDPNWADQGSAKLEVLLGHLAEVIEEGHKTLVFSQFTSMLALVRRRLEEQGISYVYLDGQTRDRRKVVERFQTDPDVSVFLISLKAGGFGLNLTAAEYVFILDPWWNPAVEQQAIDRAHRIGQTRPVFAYRLICRDTVEQRIIDLQNHKRRLAEAIVGGEQNPLRSLTRDDLERLLS